MKRGFKNQEFWARLKPEQIWIEDLDQKPQFIYDKWEFLLKALKGFPGEIPREKFMKNCRDWTKQRFCAAGMPMVQSSY